MNEQDIIKRIESIELKSNNIIDYLSSRATEKQTEHLCENDLINNKTRLANELNLALGNLMYIAKI
jgi:hypothetical protein